MTQPVTASWNRKNISRGFLKFLSSPSDFNQYGQLILIAAPTKELEKEIGHKDLEQFPTENCFNKFLNTF